MKVVSSKLVQCKVVEILLSPSAWSPATFVQVEDKWYRLYLVTEGFEEVSDPELEAQLNSSS